MVKEIVLRVDPAVHADPDRLKMAIGAKAGFLNINDFSYRIRKRSIDARSKNPVLELRIIVASGEELPAIKRFNTSAAPLHDNNNCIVVGAGPAGLFAAIELIKLGIKPIVLERGKAVRDRRRDLAKLNKEHIVNPESNYCFGEGGAGTYSDGKLYTRSNKRGDVDAVLQQLIAFGADEDIAVDAHPHIGTNKLPKIIENIRNFILDKGGEIKFNCKLTDLNITDGKITSVIVNDQEELAAKNVILATGHSARDIFELLHKKDILIENKPFALGVRVEHPQSLIDASQYHQKTRNELLPPASYSLVAQTGEKAAYSFCMCPGGIVAPCATSPGEVVTNGWSPSKRNNPFANSGIVVPVDENDWAAFNEYGPLAAMKFQSSLEVKAWEFGGKTQKVPAQGLEDFVNGKLSSSLAESSYIPGLSSCDISEILPKQFSTALKLGFKNFDSKIRGFISNEAVIHAVESRTSSPVKIPRDREKLHHPEISNLFPCGEGAGYAGGIMSAAIDGIKCAKAVV